MAYDEKLADRVRDILEGDLGVSERKMFGGLAFMVDGHSACESGGCRPVPDARLMTAILEVLPTNHLEAAMRPARVRAG